MVNVRYDCEIGHQGNDVVYRYTRRGAKVETFESKTSVVTRYPTGLIFSDKQLTDDQLDKMFELQSRLVERSWLKFTSKNPALGDERRAEGES